MTEIQKYRVLSNLSNVEIRIYEPCVVAEISMKGQPNKVGNMAFGPLVGYISKNNISMTSPVLQEARASEQGDPTGEWVVSFVLPAGAKAHDLPIPQDSRVSLREIPEHMAAATTWTGSWKYSEVENRTESLLNVVAHNGYTVMGPARWARYDPPWKPWFARRNEVIIPIGGPGAG